MASDAFVSVALFGAGRIGNVHFRNLYLNQRVKVCWVVEADIQRAHELLDKYKARDHIRTASLEQASEVYSDKSVEAVIVCTPSFTHEEIVIKALNAGKAVFCEKPLAPTLEALCTCYSLAKTKDAPLFCAFNRRWDPQLRQMYNNIKAGELGNVRVAKSTSRDPPSMTSREYIMSSGGIFLDSAIHDIDMLCWLVDKQPLSVYASGHATHPLYSECDDVDSCVVVIRFEDGIIGTCDVSREAKYGYDQRVEVLGTEGMIQSENKHVSEMYTWGLDGSTRDPIYSFGPDRYQASYGHEMDHFLDAVQGKTTLEVDARSTILVSTIAEACKKSVQTNTVVSLDGVIDEL